MASTALPAKAKTREFKLTGGRLFVAEKDGFPTVALLVRGQVGSNCYNCWKRYYSCIFGGGSNCVEIGSTCNSVCKREGGNLVVLASTTPSMLQRRLRLKAKL